MLPLLHAVHLWQGQVIDWYQHSLAHGGYPLVALLMAAESSLVPLPSELVIPFAAWVAHQGGSMSVPGVVVAGTLGSWVGASAMYFASRLAGRPLILAYGRWLQAHPALLKYGRFLLVTPESIEKAERWSSHFGSYGVFAARLLPVIRHLIGIPAGVVRMPYWVYSAWTLAGSALWCTVLAWVGVTAGQDERLVRGEVTHVLLWLIGALGVLGFLYYFLVARLSKRVAGQAAD